MTDRPIIVRCMCCNRVDVVDMDAADYDTLADAIEGALADSQED